MHSSTSSSERALAPVRWLPVFGAALLIFLVWVAAMELRLDLLGYRPTIIDSQAKWLGERARASQLGERALILVGGSRIQLALDLDTLRSETGLEPVQLAVDGDASPAVLAGLAADPSIRGTVLVDYYDGAYLSTQTTAQEYQEHYDKHGAGGKEFSPYGKSEKYLTEALQYHLRSYADGADPYTALTQRVFSRQPARQYLFTLPDRSRYADYSLVPMPAFYYHRVARNLGVERQIDPFSPDVEAVLRQKIAEKKPFTDTDRMTGFARGVAAQVAAIRQRGGRVFFVAMPTSGMVREMEERMFPRDRFWDPFMQIVGAPALRAWDDPILAKFVCPDGSHLDMHDRAQFTLQLIRSLGIAR